MSFEIDQQSQQWKIVSIDDAMESIIDYRGKTPAKSSSGIPLITAKVIEKGKILQPNEFIAEETYDSWMRRGFPQKGDVLITTEAPLGEVAQISDPRVALAQRVILLRGKKGNVDNSYLRWVLQSTGVQEQLLSRSTGSTVKGIKQSELRKVQIPLPPIAEQKRIAAILDKAEELRGLRRKALGELDAIVQSIFLEMFSNPVKNPKEWERVRFSDLLSAIESGRSPNCLDRPAEGAEWGVLKLGAVTWCEYKPLENKALPPDETPDPSLEVNPGDLLFTRKNTFDLVAASALVRSTPPHLLLPDLIFRFRLKSQAPIDLCFLHQLLINPAKRREIQKLASGSASSMPNISKTKLEGVLIELPPLSLQKEFAQRVEEIEQLKTTHRESLAQLDALFASLQHRAFRGEL